MDVTLTSMRPVDSNYPAFLPQSSATVSPPKAGFRGRLLGFALLLAIALLAIRLTDLHVHSVPAPLKKASKSAATLGH